MTNTQSKHTATPWRVMTGVNKSPLTYDNGKYFKITSEDNQESMYILVGGNKDNLGERQFNAEFIVKAVNTHDGLVALVKEMRNTFDNESMLTPEEESFLERLNNAIEKVGA